MKIYIIWLAGVILWNYGVPKATPLEDVLVAIILSFVSMFLNKYLKKAKSAVLKFEGSRDKVYLDALVEYLHIRDK